LFLTFLIVESTQPKLRFGSKLGEKITHKQDKK